MRGFDPKFRDLPDYIDRITREIWEDRGIGEALDIYYGPDVIVRGSNAIVVGNQGIKAATLATLHEFPDRQLVNEDVIWSGDEDTWFHSSHRLISVMRKQNDGAYGPGAGQLVRARVIADCVCKDNMITEEWLVRDHASFAFCLGTTPQALAANLVAQDLARDGKVTAFTLADDVAGPYVAHIDESAEAETYATAYRRIWGAKTPAAIRDHYRIGAAVSVSGGETLNGWGDLDRFVISHLASFPDLELTIDHLVVNRDPGQPVRIAIRMSMTGTHTGWGRFGQPTGARVYILAMTHAYMVDGLISHEWLLTDEVAIWKQILGYAATR